MARHKSARVGEHSSGPQSSPKARARWHQRGNGGCEGRSGEHTGELRDQTKAKQVIDRTHKIACRQATCASPERAQCVCTWYDDKALLKHEGPGIWCRGEGEWAQHVRSRKRRAGKYLWRIFSVEARVWPSVDSARGSSGKPGPDAVKISRRAPGAPLRSSSTMPQNQGPRLHIRRCASGGRHIGAIALSGCEASGSATPWASPGQPGWSPRGVVPSPECQGT